MYKTFTIPNQHFSFAPHRRRLSALYFCSSQREAHWSKMGLSEAKGRRERQESRADRIELIHSWTVRARRLQGGPQVHSGQGLRAPKTASVFLFAWGENAGVACVVTAWGTAHLHGAEVRLPAPGRLSPEGALSDRQGGIWPAECPHRVSLSEPLSWAAQRWTRAAGRIPATLNTWQSCWKMKRHSNLGAHPRGWESASGEEKQPTSLWSRSDF